MASRLDLGTKRASEERHKRESEYYIIIYISQNMAGHRMLRSFALPVMQLLKEAKILNENKEWASFEIQISIGLCYTMQKQGHF